MTDRQSATVRVPATTANLGPAFDCAGLALDIWNQIKVSLAGSGLNIQMKGGGAETLKGDESNLIYRSLALTAERHQIELPQGILIEVHLQIPPSSGLGSSASAIIGGILAADQLFSIKMSRGDILQLALMLEDHADNLAACLYGGLTLVANDNPDIIAQKISIQPLHATIALPLVSLSTQEARKTLPGKYDRTDVVFNIARTALLINSLTSGELAALKYAMQDRIHQPYRLRLIPGGQGALDAAKEQGALGAVISGAGPSLIAFHERPSPEIGEAMKAALDKEKTPARILRTATTNAGASIQD